MDLSVIICTYNRRDHLRNVLTSLAGQELSHAIEWDIVVVDNNSTDDTHEVTKAFSDTSPVPVHYAREEKQGLSHARNRGIVESRGRYVAFIDDDAIADPHWVSALYGALKESDCDCVGGRIYLKPERELPRWLNKDLWGFLGHLDYGDKVLSLDRTHTLFGGNMAFSRAVFESTGLFNPDYGRKGNDNFGGEEYELFLRLLNNGGKGVYAPEAVIYHVIGAAKLRKTYFRNLHYRAGILKGKNYGPEGGRSIKGIPVFIFPQAIRSILRYLNRPNVRMQMNIWWYFGFMQGRMRATGKARGAGEK
jgi:glycosyltransferase involved in cell wall biosynthesis